MEKLIVILGPTASGKSELAIKLALRLGSRQTKKKFGIEGAEIISADSRQIYKEMDIGTGKVTKKEMKGVPHHLLDVASPKRRFTVAQYRKFALKAIDKIFKKGKIPILCGGTGFYIQAVVDGIVIPQVPPDWRLRSNLNKLSARELYQILEKLDPQRARTIEKKNPRRLIRAIEIAKKIGKVPILKKKPLPYPVLMLGIKKEKKELSSLIRRRFFKWLKQGFLKEVLNLKKSGLSWKRIEEFGIHYRTAAQYLQKKSRTFLQRIQLRQKVRDKITEKEFIENSLRELQNYAKRQMTWFKRHPAPEQSRCGASKKIKWVKNYKEAERMIRNFLNS